MAITVTFTPAAMTGAQYDEILRRLEASGQGTPAGRRYHVATNGSNTVQVIDVWDSPETFGAFGQTLLPILQELGIDPGQPAIAEVHNIVTA
jgi:hypothetical protein